MSGSFALAAQALEDALHGLDARRYSGDEAAKGVEVLARTEKVCAAKRAELAAWAAECGAHRDQGFSNPTEWLARKTGKSTGEARTDLETATALLDLADTKSAVDAGDLSLAQAAEIARTEAECPGSEAEMLALATTTNLRRLKETGNKRRQEAIDPAEMEQRRRGARAFVHWQDEIGMTCFRGALPPEVGVPFISALEAETDRLFLTDKESTRDQRAADAFVKLVSGKGKGRTTRSDLVVVWDLNADVARIPATGPVSMKTVRDVAKNAYVTGLTHDGKKVDQILRYGRYVPKELRLVLSLGDPPGFDGAVCQDCGRRYHLQIDHVDPRANGGPTVLANLEPRCPPCHEAKTERDRKAGLLTGAREGRGPP